MTMPTFSVRIHPNTPPDWCMWRITRNGRRVAMCGGHSPPTPGCAPGAWVDSYATSYRNRGMRWRIVTPDRRTVAYDIPDEPTAHALLAWLCPQE